MLKKYTNINIWDLKLDASARIGLCRQDEKQDFHQNMKIYNNKHTREMGCTSVYHHVNSRILLDLCWALCLWDVYVYIGGRILLRWVYNSGVDEIHPENLNVLDVMGLSWLTSLCNLVWTSVVVWSGKLCWWFSIFTKESQREYSDYREITILPSWKESVTVSQTLLERTWDLAQTVCMCFIDPEKAYKSVPRGILWRAHQEWVFGPWLRAITSVYCCSRYVCMRIEIRQHLSHDCIIYVTGLCLFKGRCSIQYPPLLWFWATPVDI